MKRFVEEAEPGIFHIITVDGWRQPSEDGKGRIIPDRIAYYMIRDAEEGGLIRWSGIMEVRRVVREKTPGSPAAGIGRRPAKIL